MGVDGLLPVALRASAAQDAAKAADAPDRSQNQNQNLNLNPNQAQQEREEAAALARRSSLPTFADEASASAASRRWRSFDAALLASGRSTASASDARAASGLARLSRRIEEESACLAQRRARLGRRREWLRSMRALFSASRKERVALLQVQLVAEMARANRSLEVLNDVRTLALASDALDLDGDIDNQALLDSVADADRALDEDCLHHVLALQAAFLRELAALHARKDDAPAPSSAPGSAALIEFLQEATASGSALAPQDRPTVTLARFERLLARHRLLQPALKRALEELCVDTLRSLATPPALKYKREADSSGAAAVFDERAPRDVLLSLVRELEDAVAGAELPAALRPALRALVEQMVFSRLACAGFRGHSTDLDELNAAWRERAAKARVLGLADVGLAPELLARVHGDEAALFAGSIEAFSRLPHLVPSSVLAALLDAVRALYAEAAVALQEPSVSADVLLPLLVFVLSRAELPHLHSQVFLMEQFAVGPASAGLRLSRASDAGDEDGDGSEAAYYLACLQAAMGYLMGGCGAGSACGSASE